MSKKLYVGNLPFSVTQEQLKEVFSKYGEVEEASIIVNKFTGRSKGFGFVTLKDDAAADAAIAEMHDKDFEGRKLTVNVARPMEERPQRGFSDNRHHRQYDGGY